MDAYNISSTTLQTYHISTAMVPRVIMEIGEVKTYETLVWAWNPITKVQGEILDIISHPTEQDAKQEHVQIVQRYVDKEDLP